MKSKIIFFLSTFLVAINSFSVGFFETKESKIINPQGKDILLKSINITQLKTEKGYKNLALGTLNELKSYGFNTIRLEVDLSIAESIASMKGPKLYQLPQSFLSALNETITNCKSAELYAIIALRETTSEENPTNQSTLWRDIQAQSRFIKIWEQLANLTSKETHVVGFDVLPEPDRSVNYKQFQFVANNIIGSIRRVDQNHLIFIGGISAFLSDWNKQGELPFKDEKLVYSLPFFDPEDFTLQKSPWNKSNENEKYPDFKEVEFPTDLVFAGYSPSGDTTKMTGSRDMTFHAGEKFLVNDPSIVAAVPVLEASRIGEGGEVIFQGVVVTEYDADGKPVGDVLVIDPASTKNWTYEPQKENDGSFKVLYSYTFDQKDVLRITETKNKSVLYSNDFRFLPKQGYFYSIGAYIKPHMTNFDATIQAKLRLEKSLSGQKAIARDKNYIANSLEKYHDFEEKYDVPVFINKIGIYGDAIKKGNGSDEYMNDLVSVLTKNEIGFSFQSFDGSAFGLFKSSKKGYEPEKNREGILEAAR